MNGYPLTPGQAFTDSSGHVGLLVRSERRSGSERDEHLLIVVDAERRMAVTRWEDPDGFEQRWTLGFTPELDGLEGAERELERAALAATLADAEAAVVAAVLPDAGMEAATGLAATVRDDLRARFRSHRDRLRGEGLRP